MGYPKNKTMKLLARTRARKFLATSGLEQMAGATSKTKSTYSPAVSWQKESKNLANPADCLTEVMNADERSRLWSASRKQTSNATPGSGPNAFGGDGCPRGLHGGGPNDGRGYPPAVANV
jgi:hypothetical protein